MDVSKLYQLMSLEHALKVKGVLNEYYEVAVKNVKPEEGKYIVITIEKNIEKHGKNTLPTTPIK